MARLLFTSRSFGSLATSDATENQSQLAKLVGKQLQFMNQTHGSSIAVITDLISPPDVDSLVTQNKEIALSVRVADCLPLLLQSKSVVAAVHVGRKGLLNKIALQTLEVMRNLGAKDISGVVGPHICGDCYEVDTAMFKEITLAMPATAGKENHLNLYQALASQLNDIALVNMGICTKEDANYFSFRAHKEALRQVGVISL